MDFPLGYVIALTTDEKMKENWPNLKLGINFKFTSKKQKGFNCVGYALKEENKDLDMLVFKGIFKLNEPLDHSVEGYANILNEFYGYTVCPDDTPEDGYEKVALYEDDNDFVHIARQLPNGRWTSKMGKYEDIEHSTLEAVAGGMYGKAKLFMKKRFL